MTHDTRDKLFAYGTLQRPHAPRAVLHGFERRQGDAPFPTIAPADGESVEGRLVEIDDWARHDGYEGRRRGDPEGSLYWRFEMADGTQVYVANATRRDDVWDADYTREEMHRRLAEVEPEVTG